jgi:hypothetical protein
MSEIKLSSFNKLPPERGKLLTKRTITTSLLRPPLAIRQNQFLFFIILFHIMVVTLNKSSLVNCCIFYGKEQLELNLCRSKKCPFYGKCKIDEINFTAKCVCPINCDEDEKVSLAMTSDHQDVNTDPNMASLSSNENWYKRRHRKDADAAASIVNNAFKQSICGTDGQDYANYCHLKKQSCLQNKQVKIFYFGKCSKILIFIFFSC